FVLMQSTVFAAPVSRTQVYVNNGDDDSLWIKFYLDGGYMGGRILPQNTTKYFNFYRLSEGSHELKIEWKDPDTCEWQEKTKTVAATGEDITVTISVVPNNISTCNKAAPKKATPVKRGTDYGSLSISVKNNDDDTLFVMLFINGDRRRERTIAKYSTVKFLTIYTMRTGSYNVSIKWKEPDTKEWYEQAQEVTVARGKNSITLETDEVIYNYVPAKPSSSIAVYIKNIDDDDLWIDVLVDSGYRLKYVKSGAKKYFGRFDKLYQGKHTVRLRWIDPDVKGWQEKKFVLYLDRDEEAVETFHTIKNTR
ncbi:MAG: hypothetical protein V3R93_03945, partial [Candidatus Hydrothermarchaeaceae archaeon]